MNKGPYADGSIDKFVRRLSSKIDNPRLNFLFGTEASSLSLEEVLKQLIGYAADSNTNVTIFDLSGIPFEVLSITVSMITRLLFDYGYYFRRSQAKCDTPILLSMKRPINMHLKVVCLATMPHYPQLKELLKKAENMVLVCSLPVKDHQKFQKQYFRNAVIF